MPEMYEFCIKKEALKFAAAHMTVFPDGSKEALHGHNFLPTVLIQTKQSSFDQMFSFPNIKRAMKKIASLWDEKLLLAAQNPFFKILKQDATELEFILCKKRYILPIEEVVLLETDNISYENLAKIYAQFLVNESPLEGIESLSVLIETAPGYGAKYTYFPHD